MTETISCLGAILQEVASQHSVTETAIAEMAEKAQATRNGGQQAEATTRRDAAQTNSCVLGLPTVVSRQFMATVPSSTPNQQPSQENSGEPPIVLLLWPLSNVLSAPMY